MSAPTIPFYPVTHDDGERMANALEIMALNGAGQTPSKYSAAALVNLVRGKLAERALSYGSQIPVERETSMTASIGSSTGITAASVVEATFLEADGVIGSGIHVFYYEGGIWSYGGESVSLEHYGITVTGTPANGDEVIITEAYNQIDMDVVSFEDAYTIHDPDTAIPAMWLQSHWALQAVQFDASEAIWYCATALAAGTYYFTIGTNWGTHCVAGKSYQFTLSTDLPVGGQIVIGTASSFYTWGAPDQSPSNWRVYTFSDARSVTPLEGPLTLTEGTDGTNLGSLSSSTKYSDAGDTLNNLQRAAYGYNRWGQSAIRQWLNSDAGIGAWWEPQNVYDRPPQQLATLPGFMYGLDAEFKSILQRVKVVTALNTTSDSEIGSSEITYDYFFLPSLEQEYIVPQASGVEGSYWPYWKERLGLTSPQAQGTGGANAAHIRYAVENHSSAQTVTLRSAFRGNAANRWYVGGTTGSASSYSYATAAFRPAPACVIC